jgi:hypothetical protein
VKNICRICNFRDYHPGKIICGKIRRILLNQKDESSNSFR